MKTFSCSCGNTLFFGSLSCVRCGCDVGLCELCRNVTPLAEDDGQPVCGQCNQPVGACGNRGTCSCNVWTAAGDQRPCIYCRCTVVSPDLSVPGNAQKWKLLEAAKRRVLYGVTDAGFSFNAPGTELPLTFRFMPDGEQRVATGHLRGRITVNLREADPVERERIRVKFNEHHRTLVGHFRHELGHYYWDLIVKPRFLAEFRETFGDETQPPYSEAKKIYYQDGAPADWPKSFISAYATMHPWEDFAETFAAFIDMTTILATAVHFELSPPLLPDDFSVLVRTYGRIGVLVNELNRDMGLLDLVPKVFSQTVRHKLQFIHKLAVSHAI